MNTSNMYVYSNRFLLMLYVLQLMTGAIIYIIIDILFSFIYKVANLPHRSIFVNIFVIAICMIATNIIALSMCWLYKKFIYILDNDVLMLKYDDDKYAFRVNIYKHILRRMNMFGVVILYNKQEEIKIIGANYLYDKNYNKLSDKIIHVYDKCKG